MPPTDAARTAESRLQIVTQEASANEIETPRRATEHHDGTTQASPTSGELSDDVSESTGEVSFPSL